MITNTSTKTILASNQTICNSHFMRSKGLMFSKKLYDEGYIFIFKKDTFAAIHMLFVFYPIDIIWLNEHKEIIEIKEQVKPFSFANPRKKSRYFIEFPAGTIKKTKTKLGHTISWK